MKIKIKNNKNMQELNEGQLLELDNPATQQTKKSSVANLYKALAAKQFIQDRKKEDVLINVVIPDKLYTNLNILKAPIDIQNLMTSAITNKSSKTRDFEKWGMVDPIATYNEADDCCATAFSKFNSKIQLASSEDERQMNKANIASEGILVKNNNVLNEITTEAATAAGVQTGLAVSHGINVINCFGAGLVSTVGATVAVWGSLFVGLCAGAHEISKYAGYKLTDGAPNGVKQNGTEITDPSKNILSNITKSTTLDFNNVAPAIETYITDITQSVRDLITGLSSNMLEEFNKISKYITNFLAVSSDKAEDYIKENSEALKEQEKLRNEKELVDKSKEINTLDKQVKFLSSLIEAEGSEQQIRKDEFIKINAIINFYKNAKSKDYEKKRMLEDALEEGGVKKVIAVYDANIGKKTKDSQNQEESATTIYLGSHNSLNEAEEELAVGNKPDLALDKIYKGLYTDLKNNFDSMCAKFDKKQMTNLDETKENMKFIIDEADKTIRDRIEKITKSSQSSSGNESGLTKAAIQFLSGHPLEADNLLEIWSRHLTDLKYRMNARIKMMTDIGNSTRTLGWTLTFLQNVMPDLLARLLTYHYAYLVLAKKGMYTYNTAKIKKDMDLYNNSSTGLKYLYEQSPRAKIIFILNNYSGDYTNTGKSCISPAEEGKFTLNENYLAYASLLAKKLKPNLSDEDIIKMAIDLANINKSVDGAESLYNGLYGALQNYPAMSLFAESNNFEAEFNNLIRAFEMSDNIKSLKETILTAYNKIKSCGNKVLTNLQLEDAKKIAQSFYIIANNNPVVIYNIYKKNEENIKKLIVECNNTKKNKDNKDNEEILNNIKKDVQKIFSNINFVNLSESDENVYKTTIENMFNSKYNNDYYSYIISFADRTKLGISNLFSEKGIKQSCAMFPVLVELATSGLLCLASTTETKDQPTDNTSLLNEMANAWQSGDIAKLYDLVNPENSESFDSAYNNIKEKEKIKELLAKDPFNILKKSNLISEFKKDYENKKDSLSLAISNPDLLNQELSFRDKFGELIASIEPELKNRNILAILTANENAEGENKEIKLKKDDDTIKQQIESLKQIISFILEVAVNTLLDQEAGEVKIITDDDLTKSINVLGNMNQNAIKFLGVNQYLNNNNNFKDVDNNIVNEKLSKFNKAYNEFKELYVKDFIDTSKKYKLTVNDIDTIFNSFAKYTKVDKLLHSNLNNINIMDGECSETDRKNAMYYYIEVLKSENIKYIMPINNFVNAINLITKKLSN